MAARRRRRPQNRIGVPGDNINLKLEPTRVNIERESPEVFVHDGSGRKVRMGGGQQHIHIHNRMPRERRPVTPVKPERPLFDFQQMQESLIKKVDKYITQDGIVGKTFEPKKQSRWPGLAKGSNPARLLNQSYVKSWLPFHWITAFEKLTTTTKGRIQLARDRRMLSKAMKTRKEVRVEERTAQAVEEYRARAIAAMAELQQAVEADKVNQGNRNYYKEKFNDAVEKARRAFQKEMDLVVSEVNAKNKFSGTKYKMERKTKKAA